MQLVITSTLIESVIAVTVMADLAGCLISCTCNPVSAYLLLHSIHSILTYIFRQV